MSKPSGAERQTPDAPEPKLRPVARVQLIAIVALVLSTLIAVAAVSIGFARAGAPCYVAAANAARFTDV